MSKNLLSYCNPVMLAATSSKLLEIVPTIPASFFLVSLIISGSRDEQRFPDKLSGGYKYVETHMGSQVVTSNLLKIECSPCDPICDSFV